MAWRYRIIKNSILKISWSFIIYYNYFIAVLVFVTNDALLAFFWIYCSIIRSLALVFYFFFILRRPNDQELLEKIDTFFGLCWNFKKLHLFGRSDFFNLINLLLQEIQYLIQSIVRLQDQFYFQLIRWIKLIDLDSSGTPQNNFS